MAIEFTKPSLSSKEMEYIKTCLESGQIKGNGSFTRKCEQWIESQTKAKKALLVHSCTAALEMSALLCELEPGDEVIMPSFTFVSTANAVVLRGATPVFVDIRPDILNIDENLIEAHITPKTKAIFIVHYAGVACEMDKILAIAKKHHLYVVEDAAQAVLSRYKGKALGTLGDFGTFSFHETKNLVSGEGGALVVNDESYLLRSEIIREKGTNRTSFLRRETAFYTWMDVGSSYICSDLLAALLLAQFERSQEIQKGRMLVWDEYYKALKPLEEKGDFKLPTIPQECEHNAHIFYMIAPTHKIRESIIEQLKKKEITAAFHYIPLHSSPAGERFGRTNGALPVTDDLSERVVRLPLWSGLEGVEKVVEIVKGI
ncbi:MAG: dTDP-4-amino-4,6-dideoxygalactose transaminase [Bdellovibrionales bacterium]